MSTKRSAVGLRGVATSPLDLHEAGVPLCRFWCCDSWSPGHVFKVKRVLLVKIVVVTGLMLMVGGGV